MQAATKALRAARSGSGAVWRVYDPVMLHHNTLRRAPDAIVNAKSCTSLRPRVAAISVENTAKPIRPL
jgi:hypothetical protein